MLAFTRPMISATTASQMSVRYIRFIRSHPFPLCIIPGNALCAHSIAGWALGDV